MKRRKHETDEIPNDGFVLSTGRQSRAELQKNHGDALTPTKPERVPESTWPVRSTGDDLWHRDAATTLRRFHAEEAVRRYARDRRAVKAEGWEAGELDISLQTLPELLVKVPGALWSCTVRDLIASAWDDAGDVFVIRGKVGGEDVLAVEGPQDGVPPILRSIVEENFGGEAREALRAIAELFAKPPIPPGLIDELDAMAQAVAERTGRKLDAVRADFEARLGKARGTFAREARREREKAAPKRPRQRSAKAGPKKPRR